MVPRCFVDPAAWAGETIRLADSDAHHLTDVLRLGPGAPVIVCDGCGGEASGEVADAGPAGLTVRVRERRSRGLSSWQLTLVQAVPKGDRMDWIVQKAVELGAAAIVPVMTERGVVRLEGRRAEQRVERWQRIATEAARQCRTAWIPRVAPVRPLREWLAGSGRPEVLIVGSLEPDARPLGEVCATLRQAPAASAALLIGPEGDFTEAELAAARSAGARPVSFGRRVLRVETAALYLLSVAAYELGVMAAG